ncbi:MAG TPA: NAD-dependent malic enzyme [Gammaproteobacteria bacterium]|nr:NAD-dependent malic enzyme [Gammaproteobacteria bacterium]
MSEDIQPDASLTGQALLSQPLWNKGTAFSERERDEFGLHGLLPAQVETLEQQLARAFEAYASRVSDLDKHIYLRQLQDANEVLFYRLLVEHLEETMPIIYTPVVGAACQQFSHIYRRPRGLFVSHPNRHRIEEILDHSPVPRVEVIVVTDGERVLGLGDQGAGGMAVPVGKLSLYTACAGIHPATTLPIMLDVGTDNSDYLGDPLYLGWRHERIRGQEYDDFIELFIQAVNKKFPNVLLQWEDFARDNAARLLGRYRDSLCTFNDDIQGTAAVTVGALLAATHAVGQRLADQHVIVVGAGSAGCGIAEQILVTMMKQGLAEDEARLRFYLVDKPGLLHDGLTGFTPAQRRFVQPRDRVVNWDVTQTGTIQLIDVVRGARPTILLGVSGQPGLFSEPIVRLMANQVGHPIIFPLSNPTTRCEATPEDLIQWTDGRAVIATGSPFRPVAYNGRTCVISQCNNHYMFPAMGLGILAVGARRVTDEMFMAASEALAECAGGFWANGAGILPPLSQIRSVAKRIALAVAAQAIAQGLATRPPAGNLEQVIDSRMWTPRYQPFRPKTQTQEQPA